MNISKTGKIMQGLTKIALLLAFLGSGWMVFAQLPPSTPITTWLCEGPTLPQYKKCDDKGKHHPPVGLDPVWFAYGCYDLNTGAPLDCGVRFEEYFSTAGVNPADLDYWTGGHNHWRYDGDATHNIGGVWVETLPAPAEPVLDTGDFQTGACADWYPNGFVAIPEPSGVDLLFVRYTPPPSWVCVENATWVRDPADPSGRSCMGTFTVEAHIEGLQPLPDSPLYEKSSRHPGHVDGVFYGTPEMNQQLAELARQYRNWYFQQHGKWIKISFNDLSLPYGGLYDVAQNWDCDHVFHRLGRSADVNGTDYVEKEVLDEFALNLYLDQYHKSGTLMHYELQY